MRQSISSAGIQSNIPDDDHVSAPQQKIPPNYHQPPCKTIMFSNHATSVALSCFPAHMSSAIIKNHTQPGFISKQHWLPLMSSPSGTITSPLPIAYSPLRTVRQHRKKTELICAKSQTSYKAIKQKSRTHQSGMTMPSWDHSDNSECPCQSSRLSWNSENLRHRSSSSLPPLPVFWTHSVLHTVI